MVQFDIFSFFIYQRKGSLLIWVENVASLTCVDYIKDTYIPDNHRITTASNVNRIPNLAE